MRLGFLLSILTILMFATTVNAASSGSILVDIIPPNPSPNENTTITVNSYTNNLDTVLIKWSIAGKTISSGIGKKSFSLTAPGAGSVTDVVVTISLPDGNLEKKITIRPSVLVLLWQATDSYVPPFYRGKSLPAVGSEIKVVAIPEIRTTSGGGLLDPKNMTYVWKKDYTNNVDGSGYGKSFFLYVNDYLENSNNIGVVASTIDQKYSREANVNIEAVEPKVSFYKNDNTQGTLWQKALNSPYSILESETIEAIPYFISPKQIQNPTLMWNWFINDTRVTLMGFRKNLMPLQTSEGTHGTSQLRLIIENREKIFQTTTKEINIEY